MRYIIFVDVILLVLLFFAKFEGCGRPHLWNTSFRLLFQSNGNPRKYSKFVLMVLNILILLWVCC